jgi:hypothetical protein
MNSLNGRKGESLGRVGGNIPAMAAAVQSETNRGFGAFRAVRTPRNTAKFEFQTMSRMACTRTIWCSQNWRLKLKYERFDWQDE